MTRVNSDGLPPKQRHIPRAKASITPFREITCYQRLFGDADGDFHEIHVHEIHAVEM